MTFPIEIERLSGKSDIINIITREETLSGIDIIRGKRIYLTGEVRSFNNKGGTGSRLVITVFAKEIEPSGSVNSGTCALTPPYDDADHNFITLHGILCKPPTLRRTPLGRLICDILLAVNRRYGRSDYLPCIAWGRTAQELSSRDVGDSVCLLGRLQSRRYIKTTDDGSEERTAYEVSVISLDEE